MLDTDIFVGGVAIILGSVVLLAAVFNWDSYYQLRKARWLDDKLGRRGARVLFALIGAGLIVLGSVIAIGLLSNTSAAKKGTADFIQIARV